MVVVIQGIPLEISRTLEAAFQRAMADARRPLPEEMSISQAADFLDVSREYILKLIKRGVLPCRLVGKRRHSECCSQGRKCKNGSKSQEGRLKK